MTGWELVVNDQGPWSKDQRMPKFPSSKPSQSSHLLVKWSSVIHCTLGIEHGAFVNGPFACSAGKLSLRFPLAVSGPGKLV